MKVNRFINGGYARLSSPRLHDLVVDGVLTVSMGHPSAYT